MKFTLKILLTALLLLVLTSCGSDEGEDKQSSTKTNTTVTETEIEESTEPIENNKDSLDIAGYWKGADSTLFIDIDKKDDSYLLRLLSVGVELDLKRSTIEEGTIITTITQAPVSTFLSENDIENYYRPGTEVKFELPDDNQLRIHLFEDPSTFTKVEEKANHVNPLDLVGNWINDNEYLTITKENEVLTISFEDEVDEGNVQFDISMEITDVIENYVFGKISKILPEQYANEDSYMRVGTPAGFYLSDDGTKLVSMGSEMTKTTMSLEEFKEQQDNQ